MADSINSVLQNISWGRLDVRLVNTRNEFARESPLAIFQSIFKHAASAASTLKSDYTKFVFHPRAGHWSNRIVKGREYDLSIIFPHSGTKRICNFADNLTRHLHDPRNNFEIAFLGEPEERTADSVSPELLLDNFNGADIWLDFAGRLDFAQKNGSRNWCLDAAEFFALAALRLKSLYEVDITPFKYLWQKTRILSYFWEHVQTMHSAQSTPGKMLIQGREGPVCLQNMSSELLPLLFICSELHIGSETTYGRGYYRIASAFDFLDRRISDPKEILKTLAEIDEKSDLGDDLDRESFTREEYIQELSSKLKKNCWQFGAARLHQLSKKSGGERTIATLPVKDQVLHRHLHRLLQAPFDRMFEDCSVGFRPRRSIQTARDLINKAIDDGYRFVVESDVDDFFDEIDWEVQEEKLLRTLPPGEPLTRNLLSQVIRTEVEAGKGPTPREKGLLQGSPLSPLLSNLYLDAFDEKMLAAGHRLVRYADDFVILARTREEAEIALKDAERFLAEERLSLNEDKTFIRPVEIGFMFLGVSFGGGKEEEFIEKLVLRKPLYIRPIYGFIGLDYDAIVIKKNKELIQRIPLNRVREIIIFGTHSISTRLLQQCSFENISVSFCSPSGGFMNTLAPDSRRFHDIEARHIQRYYSLTEGEKLQLANNIVGAKIHNYRDWIGTRFGSDGTDAIAVLDRESIAIPNVTTIDELRGHEGIAARAVFRLVANLAGEQGFSSEARVPYKKKDHLNSLLDFAYFMLTARINTLVRGRGLNPYLGVLHSSKDYYESLVYDLAEAFRFRMDALVLRIINQKIIKPDNFAKNPDKGARYYLTSAATGTFIEIFERALLSTREKGGNSLVNLLEAQIHQLMQWVDGNVEYIRIYRR